MSIYDSIGGAPAVRAAVDDFYARVLADARLVARAPIAPGPATQPVYSCIAAVCALRARATMRYVMDRE